MDASRPEQLHSRSVLPKWSMLTAIAVGMGFSLYAAQHQLRIAILGESNSFCNISDYFSCDRAALSPFSHLFGVPQSIWGLTYFSLLAIGLYRLRFRQKPQDGTIWFLRLLLLVGVAYVLRLFAITVTVIQAVCLSCLAVHLSVYIATFVFWKTWKPSVNLGVALRLSDFRQQTLRSAVTVAILFHILGSGREVIYEGISRRYNTHLIGQINSRPKRVSERRIEIPITNTNPVLGNPNAPHTLFAFVDFTCPHCAALKIMLKNIERDYPGRLRIVIKHFPLDRECNHSIATTMHQDACRAAAAAHCYTKAGAFRDFEDKVFSLYKYSPAGLLKAIPLKGVTESDLTACMSSADAKMAIAYDVNFATYLGAERTPFLVMDGEKVDSARTEEILERILR